MSENSDNPLELHIRKATYVRQKRHFIGYVHVMLPVFPTTLTDYNKNV
jgi:hypothetical protein